MKMEEMCFKDPAARIELGRSSHYIMLCINHSIQSHIYSIIYQISV